MKKLGKTIGVRSKRLVRKVVRRGRKPSTGDQVKAPRVVWFAVVMVLLTCSPFSWAQASDENPGSLWNNKARNPLLDRIARQVGDLVTVLISETSTATFSASTNTERKDNNSIAKLVVPIAKYLVPELKSSGNVKTEGTGSSTQTGKLVARMTCVVKKVLPNGNLVVEGSRAVQVNKDTQTFRLSGIIRQDDIKSDNTIMSEYIAEAQIYADGKGQISDRQKRGIITRLVDWLIGGF